jgi:hypothetical protein
MGGHLDFRIDSKSFAYVPRATTDTTSSFFFSPTRLNKSEFLLYYLIGNLEVCGAISCLHILLQWGSYKFQCQYDIDLLNYSDTNRKARDTNNEVKLSTEYRRLQLVTRQGDWLAANLMLAKIWKKSPINKQIADTEAKRISGKHTWANR